MDCEFIAHTRIVPAPFIGYARVSKVGDRSGPSFISPDVQRDTIERLAAASGLELVETIEELDVSGGKAVDERRLDEALERIEAGRGRRARRLEGLALLAQSGAA